jgi:hypothetical protein
VAREKSRDLLSEQNHRNDDNHCRPQQHVSHLSPFDTALRSAALLPESEPDQGDGDRQEPRAERCEECTRCSSTERRSKSERQTSSDRRDGTQNRDKRR